MFTLQTRSIMLAAAALLIASPTFAYAGVVHQDPPAEPAAEPSAQETTPRATRGVRATRQPQNNRNRQRPAPAAPTPEENRAAAQALATATGTSCQVIEANLRGTTTEQTMLYEATCQSGPGYMFMSSTPPRAIDCIVLAGQAEIDRRRDPAADVGPQCEVPANQNALAVITAYAAEAKVPCPVDQAAVVGKSSTNENIIYEVGCNGADGYWIEKAPSGWDVTECLIVQSQNGTCRFSTPVEQAATLKARLSSTPAAACDVSQARYMGANNNGAFYEAKCAAGDGYVARLDAAGTVQQTYPCTEAARIGGGCTLTTVAAAPASTEPAPATAPQ